MSEELNSSLKRSLVANADTDSDSSANDDAHADVSSPNKKPNIATTTKQDEYIAKVRRIIEKHFDEEISYKQFELEKISDRIFEAQNTLDKLRVCIICKYYSLNGRLNLNDYMNHPAIAQLKCEHLEMAIEQARTLENSRNNSTISDAKPNIAGELSNLQQEDLVYSNDTTQSGGAQMSKIKLYVGNVSKYLNNNANTTKQTLKSHSINSAIEDETIKSSIESSQYNQDLITHKWMVYIRSPDCVKLDTYIKKVIFHLHFSYKPHDMVEVREPPFQLIKRGWGEFPIHVQIHFKDPRNKRVDINHQIKLDWTQTGLQTFGGETCQEVDLVLKKNDLVAQSTTNDTTTKTNQNDETSKSETSNPNLNMIDTNNLTNMIRKLSTDSSTSSASSNNNLITSKQNTSSQSKQLTNVMIAVGPSCSKYDLTSYSVSSPSSFISTDLLADTSSNSSTNMKANSAENSNNTTGSNVNFDEIIKNLNAPNVNESSIPQIIDTQKAKTTSIDELLNLRPNKLTSMLSTTNTTTPTTTLMNSMSKLTPKLPLNLIKVIKPVVSAQPTSNLNILSQNQIISSNKSNIMPMIPSIMKPTKSSHNASQLSAAIKNSLLTKEMVIYKVDSSDLIGKDLPSSNLLKQQQIDQQKQQQQQSHQASSNLINSNTPPTKPQLNDINLNITNEQRIDAVASPLTKPTKLIDLNQNNNILQLTQHQLIKTPDNDANELMQSETMAKHEETNNNDDDLIYSNDHLNQFLLATSNLNTSSNRCLNETFETYLKIALKYHPIIDMNVKSKHFIGASSLQEFYSWPYGKRKAIEWLRALSIKRKCQKLIGFHSSHATSSPKCWSTKTIVLWLRSHGFTPLENKHLQCHETFSQQTSHHYSKISYVDSLTPLSDLKLLNEKYVTINENIIQNNNKTICFDDTLDEIDVVNDDEEKLKPKIKAQKKLEALRQSELLDKEFNKNDENLIEMCDGSKYVKEQLDLLGIRTNTVNLVPSYETPNESNKFSCHLVEKFLFAIAKSFAEDLIRETAADLYYGVKEPTNKDESAQVISNNTNKKISINKNDLSSTTNKTSKSSSNFSNQPSPLTVVEQAQEATLQYQKFPQAIRVIDLFNTINKHEKFDFLTNKYMAKPSKNS